MKLPWDEKYLKISFHVIITLAAVYALKLVLDAAAFVFTNINVLLASAGSFISGMLTVFSPLVIGLIIAYLFDPLADFFQRVFETIYETKIKAFAVKLAKKKSDKDYKIVSALASYKSRANKKASSPYKSRTAGTVLLYIFVFLLLGLIGAVLVVGIGSGGSTSYMDNLVDKITTYANDFTRNANALSDAFTKIKLKLEEQGLLEYISGYVAAFAKGIALFAEEISANLVSWVSSAGNKVLNFVLGVVIAFYFLKDKEKVLAKTSEIAGLLLPKKLYTIIRNFLDDVHAVFSGYIRGQLTDAFIMAFLISCWLMIIKVDFAVVIGVFSGFANLIPYFGAIVGFLLAIFVSLINGDPAKALYAAIGILILQQIDGVFIVPRVVGKKVELSPVVVLLSITVAGQLFNIGGMILAVPVCAIIKMMFSRYMERRRRMKQLDAEA